MRRYLSCFILWLMMLALLSRYALAATLQVAPVTLDLQSDQRAAAIYLTNSGKAAIHAQIRVYEWTQKNGKDVLVATGEVVSSPAMTSLAPGPVPPIPPRCTSCCATRFRCLLPGTRARPSATMP